MRIPIIFIAFLAFLIYFQFILNKNSASRNRASKKFWNHEEESWFARKSSIEADLYLHPNVDNLPTLTQEEFSTLGKASLYKIQEKCFNLAKEPMVDLTNLLNSEIRHKYGATNLSTIETYEDNYTNYIKFLYLLGRFYFEKERFVEAQAILEEGLHVRTPISDHLILLGNLYCKIHDEAHFQELYEYAADLNTLTKSKLLNQLKILKEANF